MLNHASALYRVALFARENVARSNGVFYVFWLCMPFSPRVAFVCGNIDSLALQSRVWR